MNRCLVFAGSLGGRHVGSVSRLGGLVFAHAPWRAVGLPEARYKLPVHSSVSGRLIASVAGCHLGREKEHIHEYKFLSNIIRFPGEGISAVVV